MPLDNMYYDIDGNPMSLEAWANSYEASCDDPNGAWRIGADEIDGVRVSTVWLGLNHSWTGGIAIFETMTFVDGNNDQPWDEAQWRYATKENAREGHEIICEAIRRGFTPDDVAQQMAQITSM